MDGGWQGGEAKKHWRSTPKFRSFCNSGLEATCIFTRIKEEEKSLVQDWLLSPNFVQKLYIYKALVLMSGFRNQLKQRLPQSTVSAKIRVFEPFLGLS